MIGGRVFAKDGNIGFDIARERREAADIEARIAHLDELGIDVQVLYPSLFLRTLTSLPHVDAALCRSYNRWLADIWKVGKGRLRWVVIPPLHYIDKAVEELNFGKTNGACGVFIRGVEGDKLPTDPYFFPVYEEANRGYGCPYACTPRRATWRCLISSAAAPASPSSSSVRLIFLAVLSLPGCRKNFQTYAGRLSSSAPSGFPT